ncbi:uncharacterized protein DS421_1g18190 [Arachis hypogaea]|uniref:Uncharacterized protein n=1 Tax=Arachis hypogaea TaxID=3818 RepID=A0A445EPZ5_ARAHY|nr:uncharacterized protein DS421_1g18190 [Arachis hypogaea]RYR77550.1 hypothetical protein Ahy_A01g002056 isoform A [Arachis hypogaea]
MGLGGKVGDYAFKAFTATLGATTLYLTATFSVNLYRGFVWHNSQTVISLSLFLISLLLRLPFELKDK